MHTVTVNMREFRLHVQSAIKAYDVYRHIQPQLPGCVIHSRPHPACSITSDNSNVYPSYRDVKLYQSSRVYPAIGLSVDAASRCCLDY